jgi:hypothetical protein
MFGKGTIFDRRESPVESDDDRTQQQIDPP